MDAAGRRLNSAGRQMIGFGTALTAGFVTAVKTAADFEQQISAIQAVTASADEEVDVLRQAAIDLGRKGPFGPTQVAEAFLELAKAGLTAEEIINGAGTATINLAKAGDLPIGRAAEIAANAMRTFGIAAEDVNDVVDTLSGAANQSTLDVDDLAISMRYTGGVAAALKIPIEDVATALALLGNAGIKGSTGGTSLRRILLQLSPDSKEARKELQKLGIITEDGANQFFNAQGEAKDLNTVFQILRESTKDLTDEQKINSINTIFGARASAAALILMEQAGQGFVDMDTAIAKTDAATVAAERLDNLNGSLRRLKAAVQAYLIDAGSPFQQQLQGMVEGLTRFINKLSEGDSAWGRWIALAGLFAGIFFIVAGGMTLAVGMTLRFITALGVLGKVLLFTNGLLLRMSDVLVTRLIPALASSASGIIALARGLAFQLSLNPILLIIVAIIALGIALYVLYKKNKAFHDFVDRAWQKTQEIWDKVLPVLYAIGNALVWAANAAKDAWDKTYPVLVRIIEIVEEVAKRVGKAVTDIIDFFRDLPGNVVHYIDLAFDSVVNFFTSLPGLAAQGLTKLAQAMVAGLARLPYLFGYALGFIAGLFVVLQLKLLFLIIQTMLKLSQLFLEGMTKLVEILLDVTGQLLSAALQFAIDFPGKLLSFLTMLAVLFTASLVAVTLAVVGWIADMLSRALSFSRDFSLNLIAELPGLPSRVGGILVDVLNRVAQWATDMIAEAASLGLRFLSTIWDEFKQLPQTILDAINLLFDVATLLFEIGQKIIQGLINGIRSMLGKVGDVVQEIGSGIKKGFEKALSLRSPSKVTTEYGEMIGQGLVNGMRTERDNMIKLINTMKKDLSQLTEVQRSLQSNMSIGSLLPVQNTGTNPVNVQSGNTINTTIHNPSAQTSEESMFVTAQKLEYLGVF